MRICDPAARAKRARFERATRDNPCRIGTKPDWCHRSTDAAAAVCPRVKSDGRLGDARSWFREYDRRKAAAKGVNFA
jgi:hypothetical protein